MICICGLYNESRLHRYSYSPINCETIKPHANKSEDSSRCVRAHKKSLKNGFYWITCTISSMLELYHKVRIIHKAWINLKTSKMNLKEVCFVIYFFFKNNLGFLFCDCFILVVQVRPSQRTIVFEKSNRAMVIYEYQK